MTSLSTTLERLELNRRQTMTFVAYLELLARQEAVERGTDLGQEAARLLEADPTGGRLGAIGWHLVHIALYEETAFGPSKHSELWDRRYKHGLLPGIAGMELTAIAETLAASRAYFSSLASTWRDEPV